MGLNTVVADNNTLILDRYEVEFIDGEAIIQIFGETD